MRQRRLPVSCTRMDPDGRIDPVTGRCTMDNAASAYKGAKCDARLGFAVLVSGQTTGAFLYTPEHPDGRTVRNGACDCGCQHPLLAVAS